MLTTTTVDDDMINELARHEGFPAISILVPLDRRQPGNADDAERVRTVANQVAVELSRALPAADAERMMERVEDALGSIDLGHPHEAVGVFVAEGFTSVVALDIPVQPQVSVEHHFVVRDLLAGAAFTRPARIVVLSRGKTRCIDVRGTDATERFDTRFPVEVEAPSEADPQRRNYPIGEREHAEEAEFVFRAVVDALANLDKREQAPIVLVGTSRNVAYFETVAGRTFEIVGRVVGNHEHDSIELIVQVARLELDARRHDRVIRVCADMHDAIGTSAVAGLAGVSAAARTGRGRVLLVETDYRSRVVVDGRRVDRVEETIREVVCHGGGVVEVDPGLLTDLGCIALFTRY